MWRGRLSNAPVAAAAGIAVVAVISIVSAAIPGQIPAEIPALLLLVPITAASVLSNWRGGLPVALAAGLVHSLAFIEPRGVISLGYTQEVMTVLTFVAVASVVSVLVSRRSLANQAELIGKERMLLLRSVSHDVRNPLNAVLSASTELRDGADHDPATRRRLLDLIVDETERLDRIVGNILNLSRLQAGALVPSLHSVPTDELLSSCAARFDRLQHRDGQIVLDEPIPDVAALVDPVQIDEVLTNLVENAVRHGHAGVRVRLGATADGQHVRLHVADDGPGFSAAARARLLTPFRSTGGSTGLGLTVCQAIVDAHRGTLRIDDRPEGGTIVTVTVPRA